MKIVLGYSGGLDTSVIVSWLRENYGADVICMAADVGQRGGVDKLAAKAFATGASAFFGEDLKEEFVTDYAFPVLRAGAVYSRKYLLGTAMARPLISRRMVEVARRTGADVLAHGCTGKGNDQLRFEVSFAALAPDLKVIAPWREWDIDSREDALAYARQRGICLDGIDQEKLYSRDENLWHISHEGGPLEDPANAPGRDVYVWTADPMDAPDTPHEVDVGFDGGVPVTIDGRALSPMALLKELNEVGSAHGVGRADVIEDRVVGIKSRGVYETPGGTILLTALQELEQLVLSRRCLGLKDELAPRYADLVYEGRWWTPEREALDAMVDSMMKHVSGTVRLRLFKGHASVLSRKAPESLYDLDLASFSASEGYAHSDSSGFVKLFSLPQRALAVQRQMAHRSSKVNPPSHKPAAMAFSATNTD
ncbi:MAG: argininosuccinate synthase [Gemmatimonadetes bacterium]|nr:argininosuccinate synthase [Gemmatimonadota bacterium]MYG23657.1 argininosuccinate synthase [Gemmatimonadota bacterium]MYJ39631.1 argininosuccinate synthase [Gemmatimonadota bacterium]